jgi:hypothetical protein
MKCFEQPHELGHDLLFIILYVLVLQRLKIIVNRWHKIW